MDKTAVKNFAVWARKKLIEDIKQKAYEIGITEKEIKEPKVTTSDTMIIGDRTLNKAEMAQRKSLVSRIKEKEFNNVIEEVAYTWFNRFIALRFMEVNGYLPTGVRVLSSIEPGKKEPDIIKEALNTDLDLDRELVYRLQDANDTEGLYRYLLVKQCNALNEILPGLFEEIEDYTEILLPSNLLAEGSAIRQLVDSIPEEDFKDQVEIIGWMYQYYISEKKDEVFQGLKKNIKITKENIPAATQLFTPDWIVKYMVENSLGRLWLEGHPDEELKSKWKYYLEEAEQEPEVQKQLEEIRAKSKDIKPEDIKVLDPAMGSGHILVYAFDVLYDIYKSAGYSERDIPRLILENNLYGLDIDDRAAQLAYFAVMMKARSKSRRIFREKVNLNICAIQESNSLVDSGKWVVDSRKAVGSGKWIVDSGKAVGSGQWIVGSKKLEELVEYFVQGITESEKVKLKADIEYLIDVFYDAKEYGSILEVKPVDFDAIERRIEEIRNGGTWDLFEYQYSNIILEKMPALVKQARIMSQKYDVVCTNPPYMGSKGMNGKLAEFLKKKYPDSKSDLFAAFMEVPYVKRNGMLAMINQHSWMFLSSFEKLRDKIITSKTIINMLHLGSRAFEEIGGEVVQSTAFIFRDRYTKDYKSVFIRLVDIKDSKEKENVMLSAKDNDNKLHFIVASENFKAIPGMPIAYWVSDKVINIFKNEMTVKNIADPCIGMRTGDNKRFLRIWYEVNIEKVGFGFQNAYYAKISKLKWFPYNKGGDFRKWYGNNEFLVNWENDGEEIKEYTRRVYPQLGDNLGWKISNEQYYFKEGITWSFVSSSYFGVRYLPPGFIFDVGGSSVFPPEKYHLFLTGLLCAKISTMLMKVLNPTLNFQVGNVASLPVILPSNNEMIKINSLVKENISLSRTDWDSFETSWDFKKHPLLTHKGSSTSIEQAFNNWAAFAEKQFYQLKANEEELNRIFIEIYGLQEELTPEVEDKDITIRKADRVRDIKSFISYAVGCMFGRYSIDAEGLIYAGGNGVDSWKWIVQKIIGEVQNNEGSKLRAIDSLAKSDGLGGGNLSCDSEVSKRGNICIDKPDTQGCSFDTIKYSGGTGTQIDSRIYEFLVNCTRFKSGSGDANNACPAFRLCEARRSDPDTKLDGRNCKDDILTDEQSKITLSNTHYPLPTNYYPLPSVHCPLSTIHFLPDMDNVLPITDDEYFEDDIVSRFIEFLKVTFGEKTLEENLDYIADTLGRKSSETARQAIRRYFLKEFYKDHVQVYQKRPIYWLFDSGRQDGFKALIYMHRYDEFTVARVRTDYLHKLQKSYEAEIKRLDIVIDSNASQREKTNARKKKEKILKQIDECLQYDQVIAHIANQKIKIDLDDGVKVNYAKFQGIEIPQGEGRKPLKANLLAKI